jgi:hypothetical protein
MGKIVVALVMMLGAFAPPADNTLRLPVLGITIEVPPGTEWKATINKGEQGGVDSDIVERTTPSTPSLLILIDRNPQQVDCATIMDRMQGQGYSIVSGEDRLPASWHPKMAQKDTVALACLDTKPGNIDAVTTVSASEDDLQMIRAILDSLAKHVGSGNPETPPVEMLKLPVLGVSIQMPAGAEWKAETYTDDKGTQYDSLSRTSPSNPALSMLISRSTGSTCDALMQGAPSAGFTVRDAGGLVPSSWERRVAISGGTTIACMDESPGSITAALGGVDFTDESKQSIRALLQSVASAYGK